MSRVSTPELTVGFVRPHAAPDTGADAPAPTAETERSLEHELEALRREVVSLRTQRQRDMATARGLGEALQSLRDGAMALRAENEDLRRQLEARSARRR